MRILVIGDTGFIGSATAERLARAGHDVTGVSRKPVTHGKFAHHIADRNDAAQMGALARKLNPDVAIDIIAYTLKTTAPLLDALSGALGRYVLLSSGDVYRNYGILIRLDNGMTVREISEEAQLRAIRFPYRLKEPRGASDPSRWLDDYDKIPIEERVRALNEWTILRLPMLFGPGDRQRRFAWAIAPMLAGADALRLPKAWADWRSTYGYIDDIAAGIALAACAPKAANKIYNLGDANPPSHSVWAQRFSDTIGWQGKIEIGEDGDPQLMRMEEHLDLRVPLVMSSARIREELGFAEPTALQDALARTIASERAQKPS